jgi:aldehyde dehydrogenase (NAD+)
MKQFSHFYIGGEWIAPHSIKVDTIFNPADLSPVGSVPVADEHDVNLAVDAAKSAFPSWSSLRASERATYIAALAGALKERENELVDVITNELGAPTEFCKWVQVKDPIEALEKHVGFTYVVDDVEIIGNAKVFKEPIGVCALITPWNYPLHQLIGKVAPALIAGCTMVLKPSEVTPIHAFIFAQAVEQAGLPKGVFNLVNGPGDSVGERLCSHHDVDMVSFTGSSRAGSLITKTCADQVKRVCLELGGKSPLLICDDAALTEAVQFGVEDVMINSGQTCTALSRILIHKNQYHEAIKIAKQHAESLSVGHPKDPNTFMGPLVSESQLATVKRYIEIGISEGATLVSGGYSPSDNKEEGFYLLPTVFADVASDMIIAQEEIFGPVVVLMSYENEEEMLRLANDTDYGLSARIWSQDKNRAINIARKVRAGQVYINDGDWNNQAPFGGYKRSGNGRELGAHGVYEYLETKSVLT